MSLEPVYKVRQTCCIASMKPQARQGGAVLMIALVMIFVMSILGVSAMRGATLEGQLANNTLQKEITFQSAESSTDILLAQDKVLENMICQPNSTTQTPEADQIEEQNTYTVLEDGGQTHVPGFEIGGPKSARRFIATGFSELPGANTSTTIAQGVVLLGAKDSTGGC